MMKAVFWGVLAFSVSGHLAGAATFNVENFNLKLRYDGTAISDLFIISDEPGEAFVDIAPGEFDYGIAEYSHLSIGDVVSLTATIAFPVPEPIVSGGMPNGASSSACDLGGRDCSGINYATRGADDFTAAIYDYDILTVPLTVGSVVDHFFWGEGRDLIETEYGQIGYASQHAYFTVLEVVNQPAPVPLPAGALLLPAAVGTLGLLRSRRRAA